MIVKVVLFGALLLKQLMGVVEYTNTINNNEPTAETDCNALTPQFVNIGK